MACIFFRNEVWENSIKLKLFTDAAGVSVLVQFSATPGAMANGRLIGYIVTSLF